MVGPWMEFEGSDEEPLRSLLGLLMNYRFNERGNSQQWVNRGYYFERRYQLAREREVLFVDVHDTLWPRPTNSFGWMGHGWIEPAMLLVIDFLYGRLLERETPRLGKQDCYGAGFSCFCASLRLVVFLCSCVMFVGSFVRGEWTSCRCLCVAAAIFRMLAALPAQDLEMHCDCCVNVPDAFLHARRECLENESTLPQFMKSLQSCNDTAHKLLPLVAAAIASRDVEFFRWFVSSMISPVLGLWQGSWQYWAWRLSALMGSIPMLGYCDAAMFAAPFDTMYWAVCSTDVAVVKWCHEHGFLFNQSAAVLALEAGAKDIVEYMWHGHPKDCAMYCCRHPKSCLGRSPFIPEPVCAVMCVATLNADLLTWYFECGGTADERCWTLFQAQVYAFVAMAALGGFHRRGRVNEGADLYFPTYSAEDPTDGEYMLRGIQMAYEAGVLAAPGDALKAQVSSKLRAVFHCLLEHRVAYSTGTYEFCQVAREGCLWDVHRHIPFSGFMDVSVLRGDVETWGLAVCKNCDDFSWVDEGVVPDAGGVPWKTPEETDEGALWVNPPPNGGARVPLLVPSSSSSSFTPMTDESKDDEEEVFAQPRGLSAERAEVLREMTTQSRQRLFYAAQMKVLREAIFEAWPPTKLCNGIVVTPGEQVVTLVMEFAFAVSAREGAYRQFARRFFNETGKRRDVEVLFEFEDEYAVECTPTCRAIQAGEHPPLPSRLPPATLERMMSLGSTVWTFAPGGWCRRPACFHPLYKHRYQAEKEGVVLKKRKTGV